MEHIEIAAAERRGVSVGVRITVSGTAFEAHFIVRGDEILGPSIHGSSSSLEVYATQAAKDYLRRNRAAIFEAARETPFEELERLAGAAAARIYGCSPDEIFVELDEANLTKDGKKSIIVNWQQSMTVGVAEWRAVAAAVREVLPAEYRDYHVTTV